MRRWEYCIFTALETSKTVRLTLAIPGKPPEAIKEPSRLEVFKRLGEDGWELVAVNNLAPGSGINEFYFKREIL